MHMYKKIRSVIKSRPSRMDWKNSML
jgi:hypothetical protein